MSDPLVNLSATSSPTTITYTGPTDANGNVTINGVTYTSNGGNGTFSNNTVTEPVFTYDTNLTSIVLGSIVTTIPASAFKYCSKLTSITIPPSVITIGEYAFSDCSLLTSVNIPSSVTSIVDNVFTACTALTSINVDSNNSIYSSENGILYNKNKSTLISFPFGSSLTSFSIPSSVTSIGAYAFFGCGLTSIIIPNNVTSIGNYAFSFCSGLKFVWIPFALLSSTNIANDAFTGCSGLGTTPTPNATVKTGNTVYTDAISSPSGNNLYTTTGASFYGTSQNVRVRPATVLIFNTIQTTSLVGVNENITINNYVYTSLDNNGYSPNYHKIFVNVTATAHSLVLYDVNDQYKNKNYRDELANALLRNGTVTIGNNAFRECRSLAYVSIAGVTSIPNNAFSDCSSLTSVTIPPGVTSIGENAFYNCIKLTSVNIPSSVTSIGTSAFHNCTSLTNVTTNSSSAWVYSHTDTNPAISNGVYNGDFYGLDLTNRTPSSLTVQVVTSTPPTPPPTVNPQTPSDNPICVVQ